MNVRPLLIVNVILIAAMAALTFWAWPMIPDGAQLPVHWNIHGVADRLGTKEEALLALPAIAVVLTLMFLVLPTIDPRQSNIRKSAKLWNAVAIGVVLLISALHAFLVLSSLGYELRVSNVLVPGIAGLFALLGNYLGKTQSNWFVGVRTPWTLSSDYSWEKTHRWAGRLFVLTGIVTFAAWLLADERTTVFVMIGAIVATSLASVVLSYFYWRNDPDRAAGNGGH